MPEPAPTRLPIPTWQAELREAFRSLPELLDYLALETDQLPPLAIPSGHFPLLVPRSYAARMRRSDPTDPLLRQVLPLAAEAHPSAAALLDPVGDAASERAPGLLQKYSGRALLLTTAACAIHCRYCFRQHFPYADSNPARDDWRGVADALSADPQLSELILSGGDPLSLSNERLSRLSERLRPLPQLQRLRLHTRWPVVLPNRVDPPLLAWLADLPWTVTIVIHANHPAEVDAEVMAACRRLRGSGALLLNQSVLLAGVNDDAKVLAQLSESLHAAGVLPYYLHLLDPVAGAEHFNVDQSRGEALIAAMRARLPGYLVPRLAREVAGETSKRVLA
jgi:EF-P beta-lysylation protein EpmB